MTIPTQHFGTTLRSTQPTQPPETRPLLRRVPLALLILMATGMAGICQNQTPLTQAVIKDDVRLVKQLLAQGEEVNRTNKFGATPLMLAAFRENKDMVDALLAEGADVNLRGWVGTTALHWACDSAHDAPGILIALIKGGANLNVKRDNDLTPVLDAALHGKLESLQILQSAGAAFTNDLVYASALGQLDIVKERLKGGADVNARNESGRTPLAAAAANGHLAVVNVLLEHGANVNSDGKDGNVTKSALIFAAQRGRIEVVKALLDKKAGLEADSFKETALFMAVDGDFQDVVKYLLDHGADPNGLNPDGEPVLFTAAQKHADILKILLDGGAHINVTNELGSTALIIAAYYGNAESVLTLLSKGARTSSRTTQGMTALQIAKGGRDREQIVEILSDPDAATKKMADFKAAKPSTQDSKTMTKAQWKQTYYSRFPVGSIVTVTRFKSVFGQPSRTQTVQNEAYWYYTCSDGVIQVVLNDPSLLGSGACVQNVNDY